MNNKYSVYGAESLVKTINERKEQFVNNVIPNLKGDNLLYAKLMIGYVSDYTRLIESKVTDAKLNTEIEL